MRIIWRSLIILFLLALFQKDTFAQNSNYRWGSMPIGGGGYVTGLVIHPSDKNLMYMRTDVGGAYRWNPVSGAWEQMLNWVGPEESNLVGVDGMALDPRKPDRIYLALGKTVNASGGVYRSDDRGRTWKLLMKAIFEGNGREARWIGECIAVDPENSSTIYAGTRKDGLWRSVDDGESWKKVSDVPAGYTGVRATGVRSIVFERAGKNSKIIPKIYIGVPGEGIYQSTNRGQSFTRLEGSPASPARIESVKGRLYVTHDKGVSVLEAGRWTNISPAADKNYVGLAVDSANPDKLIVAQRYRSFHNPIFRSTDGGKNWQQIRNEVPATFHVSVPWWSDTRFSSATSALALAPGTGELYYSDWFGVWKSPDIRAEQTDWHTLVKGHEETVVLTLTAPLAGALVYSGVADVAGFKHADLSTYPQKQLLRLNEIINIAVPEKFPEKIAVLGCTSWTGDNTALMVSDDAGETWQTKSLPAGASLGRLAVSSLNPNVLVYINASGAVFSSSDRGGSWSKSSSAPEPVIEFKDIWKRDVVLVSDKSDGSFYLIKEGLIYLSVEGKNWRRQNSSALPVLDRGTNLVTVPGKRGEIWACLSDKGLWKSFNGGRTFKKEEKFSDVQQITWGAPLPGSKNAAGYCFGKMNGKWGMFRTVDGGNSWHLLNDDTQQFPTVSALAADRNVFGRIYIGTGGMGVLYGEPVE